MAQAEPSTKLPSEPKPSAPKPAPHTVTIRRRSLVVAFIAALASVGVAYLVGWTMQWREVSLAREARDTATSKLGATVKALELRVVLLEARRQLALALSALDERNFGIASEHLGSAGAMLQENASSGSEGAKLSSEVQGFKLVATENLAEQRGQILTWSKALDKLVSRAK